MSRLRSGLLTHIGSLPFEGQGAFAKFDSPCINLDFCTLLLQSTCVFLEVALIALGLDIADIIRPAMINRYYVTLGPYVFVTIVRPRRNLAPFSLALYTSRGGG